MATLESLSSNDHFRIRQFVEDGMRMTTDIQMQKDSLKEMAKALGEELDIQPKYLMQTLSAAMKSDLDEKKDGLTLVEELLAIAGRA